MSHSKPGLSLSDPYSLLSFQVPNANYTEIYGINDSGVIVGTYNVAPTSPAPSYPSGFVDDKGTITSIASTGGFKGSTAQAINNRGEYLVNEANQYTGQMTLYAKDGTAITTLTNFQGTGLNNKGDIVGITAQPRTSELYSIKTGTSTTIQVAGALHTAATGINDHDEIVGNYQDTASNWHGFIQIGQKMSFLNYPGASETFIEGVNNSGVVVGYYNTASDEQHGFVDFRGTMIKVDFPGTDNAVVAGINNRDQIVGSYTSNGTVYGFVGTVECSPGKSPHVVIDHHSW